VPRWDIGADNFGVEKIDGKLEKFVIKNPISLSANGKKSDVFMVDYILDLSDKEVSVAFEQVLRKVKDFKSIQYANPFKKKTGLEDSLLLDLTPLEDLFRKDYDLGTVARIKRNLRSASDQKSYGISLTLGNSFIGANFGGSRSTAQIRIRQPDDSLEHYVLKSWDVDFEGKFLGSWQKVENNHGFRTLSLSDERFKNLLPLNFIKTISYKRNRFSYNAFNSLQRSLRKYLPLEIYSDIDWLGWDQGEKNKLFNVGLRFLLVMNPAVLNELPVLSRGEIRNLFRDHVYSKGFTESDFYNSYKDGRIYITAERQFSTALYQISKYLEIALGQKESLGNRVQAILSLRHNLLFKEVGLSFLMVLRPDLQRKYFHLFFNLSSVKDELEYSFGDQELATLYRKILIIKAALDDDGLDLIREAQSISMSTAEN
jgi:hypothetical protein